MTISASVVDIRGDDPEPEDEFFVDSNAWFWTTYSRASIPAVSKPRVYQSQQYARYIKKVLDVGAILHRSELSFAELSHQIEETEREIFVEYKRKGVGITLKQYRHNFSNERPKILKELETAWEQVRSMSQESVLSLDSNATKEALELLRTCRLDPYDAFVLYAMREAGLEKIITDDSDFGSVSGIHVFTSNFAFIGAARKQGRLVSR